METNENPKTRNAVIYSGYLLKRRTRTRQWKKKWVVLRDEQLAYYKNDKEHQALKVIPCGEILSVSEVLDHHVNHFAVFTGRKVVHFRSDSKDEMHKWITIIKDIIKQQKFAGNDEFLNNQVPQKVLKPERYEALDYNNKANDLATEDDTTLEKIEQLDLGLKKQFTPPTRTFSHTSVEYSGAEDAFMSSGVSDTSLCEIPFNPPPKIKEEEEELCTTNEGNETAIDQTTSKEESSTQQISNDHDQDLGLDHEEEEFIYEGYLLRLHKHYNQWKQYFIVLSNQKMIFYKSTDKNLERPIKQILVNDIEDIIEIEPISKTKVFCMLIITPTKRIRFCAPNEEDMTQWLASIKALIERRKANSK